MATAKPRKTTAQKAPTTRKVAKKAPAKKPSKKTTARKAPSSARASKSSARPEKQNKTQSRKSTSWEDVAVATATRANPLLGVLTRTAIDTAKNNPKLAASVAAGAVSIGASLLAGKIRGGVDHDKIAQRTTDAVDALAGHTENLGAQLAKLLQRLSK